MSKLNISLVAFLAVFCATSMLVAQDKDAKDGPTVLKGTIEKVAKKGRATILTVKYENLQTQDIPVTSKINLSVTGKGSEELLTAKQFVSTTATKSNDLFFTKEVVIHMVKGRKPKPSFAKAPKRIGQSVNAFDIAGTVVSFGDDDDYKDYKALSLKVGSQTGKVLIEKGYKITVATNDVSLIAKGAKIEVEGKPGRGGRFTITKATVPLDKEFKAEDFDPKRKK